MGHPKKTEKTAIGCKRLGNLPRRWNGSTLPKSSKSQPFKPRFTPIRKVSPKHRKKTADLQAKLEVMIHVQELWGYNPHCQKCLRARFDGNDLKLYFCHVEPQGRYKPGRHNYSNGYVGCWDCNSAQGSRVEDPAPAWFRAEMVKLDGSTQRTAVFLMRGIDQKVDVVDNGLKPLIESFEVTGLGCPPDKPMPCTKDTTQRC